MSPLKILVYPHPALRKKSVPVGDVDEHIGLLLDNMLETMRDARGIGLSAPQVGENIRVVIVCDARAFEASEDQSEEEREEDAGCEAEQMPVIEMINPVIKKSSGSEYQTEGCLSIPNFLAKVKRKDSVEVEWTCREGKKHRMFVRGLTARIIQHEIDHLDGILFVDRLSRLKKEMMFKKMDKVFTAPEGRESESV